MKAKTSIIIGVVAVAGAFGWLLYGNLDKNVVFFLTPQELLAKGTEAYDVPVRLGGMVKTGSRKWDPQSLDLRFTITDGVKEIDVKEKGAPPQMFRDSIGVIVEGRYDRSGVFNATNLLVKHSNEYRPPKPGEDQKKWQESLLKEDPQANAKP